MLNDKDFVKTLGRGIVILNPMISTDPDRAVEIFNKPSSAEDLVIQAILDYDHPLNEPPLGDDYLVHAGYLYVADDKVIESPISGRAANLCREFNAKIIRRCDLVGRREQRKAREELLKGPRPVVGIRGYKPKTWSPPTMEQMAESIARRDKEEKDRADKVEAWYQSAKKVSKEAYHTFQRTYWAKNKATLRYGQAFLNFFHELYGAGPPDNLYNERNKHVARQLIEAHLVADQ